MLRWSLLASSQWFSLFSCILARLFNSFAVLLTTKKFLSSANSLNFSPGAALGISLMYNRNNIGPKTDLCETPHVVNASSELTPLKEVNCFLFLR
jgi:hypothetical protein